MSQPPVVVIGIPSLQTVDINFAVKLAGLTCATAAAGVGCAVQPVVSFALPNAHNTLSEHVRFFKGTHLMLVETDNTFPPDAITRLLAHDKPIVGATYLSRSVPHGVMGRELDVRYAIDVSEGGCREVSRLPVGCILIRADVIEALSAPGEPTWRLPWNPRTMMFDTDDYDFCDRARAAGFSVWCDCDLSMEVGHMSAPIELMLTNNKAIAVDAHRQPLSEVA